MTDGTAQAGCHKLNVAFSCERQWLPSTAEPPRMGLSTSCRSSVWLINMISCFHTPRGLSEATVVRQPSLAAADGPKVSPLRNAFGELLDNRADLSSASPAWPLLSDRPREDRVPETCCRALYRNEENRRTGPGLGSSGALSLRRRSRGSHGRHIFDGFALRYVRRRWVKASKD